MPKRRHTHLTVEVWKLVFLDLCSVTVTSVQTGDGIFLTAYKQVVGYYRVIREVSDNSICHAVLMPALNTNRPRPHG